MGVLNIAEQKLGAGVDEGCAHDRLDNQRTTPNAQRSTRKTTTTTPVMLSEAKHLRSEILRFAQNDSFE